MILYHGTSSQHLPEILKNGLLPRMATGCESNWEGDVESKPHLVYLTSCYPVFFAAASVQEPNEVVVIRVEISLGDLFPDEDFIACFLRGDDGVLYKDRMPLTKVNPLVDPRDYKQHAEASLKHNGIAAIERVTPEQITGHVIVRDFRTIMFIGGDSMPIPINHMIMGEHYRLCMEALFRGGEEEALRVAQNNTGTVFEGLDSYGRPERTSRTCEAACDTSPHGADAVER